MDIGAAAAKLRFVSKLEFSARRSESWLPAHRERGAQGRPPILVYAAKGGIVHRTTIILPSSYCLV